MKKTFEQLISISITIVVLILLCSGIFADIVRFFSWLFLLQYSAPETSVAGGVIVRFLTFFVSFGLVGLLFNLVGWFNSKIMKVSYFVISSLIGFALAYVVWVIERYILAIGIILGVVLGLTIAGFIIKLVIEKREGKRTKPIPWIWWVYSISFLISILLICCIWWVPNDNNWGTVLMSIGASLIGAVALGVFIQLIDERKKKFTKESFLKNSNIVANDVLDQLDSVFEEFRNDVDISVTFSDYKDFMIKSSKKYYELSELRTQAADDQLKAMVQSIRDDILNKTFIVDACKNAAATFKSVTDSELLLVREGLLTHDEIELFRKAWSDLGRFVRDSKCNKFEPLLSNHLKFKDDIEKIIKITSS